MRKSAAGGRPMSVGPHIFFVRFWRVFFFLVCFFLLCCFGFVCVCVVVVVVGFFLFLCLQKVVTYSLQATGRQPERVKINIACS